jgi:hypothetical protein
MEAVPAPRRLLSRRPFNPTPGLVRKDLLIPLDYIGLTANAQFREQAGATTTFKLDREFNVRLPVAVAANSYPWLVIAPQ